MTPELNAKLTKAAEAAGITVQEMRRRIEALLSPSKCRDTNGAIFTPEVRRAIFAT